jgi:hypothetical protein
VIGTLPSNETAPSLMAFMDDLGGIFLVLCFTGESEGVFGLAVGNLVDPVLNLSFVGYTLRMKPT